MDHIKRWEKSMLSFLPKKGSHWNWFPHWGAQENLDRLADRKDPVQAAFVQAGVAHAKEASGILSLGAIDYEPV
ncbi:hypothetical protein [Polynucleobacter necessarius]|uniref:hypothetical protein n=1 Tax=Polynucleobacter necessarius TaxID=576610 RepID=UPI001E509280|nr:hypothetical protein [Polynucleobacter necessarius]